MQLINQVASTAFETTHREMQGTSKLKLADVTVMNMSVSFAGLDYSSIKHIHLKSNPEAKSQNLASAFRYNCDAKEKNVWITLGSSHRVKSFMVKEQTFLFP